MPSQDSISTQQIRQRTTDPFAIWAEVYDDQPNPLLSLEEDFLSYLLPDVRALDVVDMGCGTGRWLQRLAARHPRSLTGIDSSREMIARAAAKVGGNTVLLRADCESAVLAAGSADLCLCSFVASHVRELDSFALQLARILRPGGQAFISDVHPETTTRLGWKRAFRYGDQTVSLQTYERQIGEVIAALRKHGFQVSALLEPCFQVPQQRMLALNNPRFDPSLLQSPAIYILQVQLGEGASATTRATSLRITGSRIAFGPRATTPAQISFSDGCIRSIGTEPRTHSSPSITPPLDLSGYLLLPGLINSHDHLDFGLFPRLGRGGYRNSAEWAADIQCRDASVISEHRRIPKPVRCWWGAIRNLLSGVTTVCHHNPLSPELLDPDFPVRVLRDFEWAHSLAFDPTVPDEVCAAEADAPFIVHAAEGIDASSAKELLELHRRGLLNERAVLIHALALNEHSVSLLNRSGAAVVWCPASNKFLFGCTHDSRVISTIRHVALGSDSPLTSTGSLLDDIAIARDAGIPAERIYEMVYTSAADIFRMRDGEGKIRTGGVADLIAVEDAGADPADTLSSLERSSIALVVLRGRLQLVRDSIRERLPAELCDRLEPLEVDGEKIWVRAPIAQLSRAVSESLQGAPTLTAGQVRYAAGN